MKKSVLKLIVCISAVAAMSAFAQTQTAATSAAAPPATSPSAWEGWVKQAKNPTDWLNWGADLRLRNEYVNNALTLSDKAVRHEQDYFRFRERVWVGFTPVTNVTVNGRLAAEEREWMKPSNAGQYFEVNKTESRSGFEERYGILDLANVKWNNALDQPLSLTAGRQEIAMGDPDDCWLVMDGTPGDGSWTFFFDSIRATYEAKDIKTKFDLIYIYQNALPDEWVPTIGRSSDNTLPTGGTVKPYYLTEQNEQGVILYASNKSIQNAQIDGYFIYKGDHRTDTKLIVNGDNADIYTFGAKITGTPADHWFYSAEGAYQFGSKQDPMVLPAYVNSPSERRELGAYGGKAKLSYLFKDKLNSQVSFIGEYLSGDDPNTKGKDEMFDVLWGRYPRWTELGTWSCATETGGRYLQMNNLGRVGVSWSIVPVKGTTFSAMYNALLAPESIPTRDTTSATTERFSRDGNFRGHFVQGILKHQFNKNISALVKGELLWEGDYYAQRDLMTFIRTELTFTF